jgi:hypothetical protein
LLFDRHPAAGRGRVVGNFSDSGGARRLPSGLPASSEGAYWSAVGAVVQQRGKSSIPTCVSAIPDPDARYYAVARILAQEDVSLLMALNPSTILLLLRKMDEYRELLLRDVEHGGLSNHFEVSAEVREHVATRYRGNPARAAELRALVRRGDAVFAADRVWPNLDLVVSWRSPAQRPYLKLLEPYLGAIPQRDYILMASEGVIAIPHEDERSGGLLATTCHFYEFIPEEEAGRSSPSVLLAQELEVGRSYVVVLSTSAGLYRYVIGDVVRVTGHRERTPVVEFLHRTGATSSLTGEKLTEDQVTAAVEALGEKSGLALEGFTLLPAGEGFPRYVLLAEFATPPDGDGARRLPRALDSELAERNIEYAAKRRSQRLGAPEVWVLAPGSYEKARRARLVDGANDAQIKPVALVRDPRFAEKFEVIARAHAD